MYSISIQSNDASYPHKLLHGIEFEIIDPNTSTMNNNSRRRGYSYPIISTLQQDYSNINIEISQHNHISNIPYINQVRQWSARQASRPGPIRTQPSERNNAMEEQNFISFSPRSSSLDDLFETIFRRLRASQTAGESSDARRITRAMIREQLGAYRKVSAIHELIQNDHECSVCQSAYQVNQCYRTLSCNHVFHKSCIDRWLLSGKTTCPMCRTEVIRI